MICDDCGAWFPEDCRCGKAIVTLAMEPRVQSGAEFAVQRVDMLAARWRDMATEEIYQMEDDPERREFHRGQASALCMAANMIETEAAGSGHIDQSSATAGGKGGT